SRGMRKTRSGVFGAAILWSAVSGAVLATAAPAWCQAADAAVPASIKEDLKAAKSLSRAFQYAAGKIAPSVVHISSRSVLRGRDFFGQPLSRNVEGVGSGIVVTRDGYIITNNHVV